MYSWHSTWNCLLPESFLFCSTAYTIQVWYVTAKIQMPSNSHSGERKTGNAVNYFRLAWISLDKQLVVKESIMHWWWSLVNENVNRFHKYFQLHRYFIGIFFWCKYLNQGKMSYFSYLGERKKVAQWKCLLIFLPLPLRILAGTIYLTICLHYTEYQILNAPPKCTSIHLR